MTSTKTTRVVSLLMSVVMVLALNTVFCFQLAYADTYDNWQYTVSDGKATLTAYLGTETVVTVPATVNGYKVKNVSSIYNTNSYKKKVTSIIIKSGVSEIGASAFSGYTSLKSVTLPETITSVGTSAFSDCTSLSTITLPASVKTIGSYAFHNCQSLTAATILGRVETIPVEAFSDCTKLTTVNLPGSCTAIEASAFSGCTALVNISLPDKITEIGTSAFRNCKSLKGAFALPASTKTVDEYAFDGCTGLTSVIIPNKVKTIGDNAFQGCRALTTVSLGNSITKLGSDIFAGCTSLKKAVFGGKYVKLSYVFDSDRIPTVYYASSNAESWKSYTGSKKSYANPKSVKLSGTSSITVGGKTTLKATITPNASSLGSICFYSSSNPTVATVSGSGVVTGKAGGTAKITATTITGVSASVTVKVVPKAVSNLKAVPATTSSIKVSWNSSANASGYIVYRSTSANGTYSKVATVLTKSYTDKGLTKGKTYYYKVRAYVTSGSSTYQSNLSSYASAAATSPAPSTVKATKYASGTATIQWTKAVGAEGYEVAYASSLNGTYYSAGTVSGGSSLAIRKSGLTRGKTYYFKVRSYTMVNGTKVYSNFTRTATVKV